MTTQQIYAKCDAAGMLVCIKRTGKSKTRRYEVIIDFDVKKSYRQRQSAIRFLNRQCKSKP